MDKFEVWTPLAPFPFKEAVIQGCSYTILMKTLQIKPWLLMDLHPFLPSLPIYYSLVTTLNKEYCKNVLNTLSLKTLQMEPWLQMDLYPSPHYKKAGYNFTSRTTGVCKRSPSKYGRQPGGCLFSMNSPNGALTANGLVPPPPITKGLVTTTLWAGLQEYVGVHHPRMGVNQVDACSATIWKDLSMEWNVDHRWSLTEGILHSTHIRCAV